MLRESGSALLLVLGATAALGALALATLSFASLSYEIAVLEHHGEQARLLAHSGVDLVALELQAGRLALPAPGIARVWQPALPAPPDEATPLPAGCGVTVRLSSVVPTTPIDPEEPGPVLIDAVSEARCGRGYSRRVARFAVMQGGPLTRLY